MSARMRACAVGLFAVCAVLLLAAPASATWSVVGVDPETGEVGVAVASCVQLGGVLSPGANDLVALVPGKGAGVTQAALNQPARDQIEKLISDGKSADEVIAGTIDASFDESSSDRQHGVVLLNGQAAGFTGQDNMDVAYDQQGTNVSAQGNILVSQAVIDDAVEAFEQGTSKSLGDRLIDALEAGALAGGDSRCGEQTALFAHIVVIDENGLRADPNVANLTIGVAEGGENPVARLATAYRDGMRFGESIDPPAFGGLLGLLIPLVLLIAIPIIVLAFVWRRRSRR